jgi:hypothetical protein
MKKLLLFGALALGLIAPVAAQVQPQVSSNTILHGAISPGGTAADYALDTIRDGTRFATTTQTGAATSTAASGTLMWIGTAPTTWAVTLPLAPFAGEIVTLTTDTTLTTMVTVTANTGDTLHATYTSQTLTALTPVIFQYQLSSKVWFRIK